MYNLYAMCEVCGDHTGPGHYCPRSEKIKSDVETLRSVSAAGRRWITGVRYRRLTSIRMPGDGHPDKEPWER